jgi:hypothetical protein
MAVWGSGKGTALVLLIGLALIGISWAFDTVFVVPFAMLGAAFVGLGIGIFLCWLLFTDRKPEELFEA